MIIYSVPAVNILAKSVAKTLRVHPDKTVFKTFADGEHYVRINKTSAKAVVFGATGAPADQFIDTLLLLRALRDNESRRITLVLPYMGYGRADKKFKTGEPVAARLFAKILGQEADEVILVDPHSPKVAGYFKTKVKIISTIPIFLQKLRSVPKPRVVVAPDSGAQMRARELARHLNAKTLVLKKTRPAPGVAKVSPLKRRLRGINAIIIDDMIDTGGTLRAAASALRAAGIAKIYVAVSHPVFRARGISPKLGKLEALFITDSIAGPALSGAKVISLKDALSAALK